MIYKAPTSIKNQGANALLRNKLI